MIIKLIPIEECIAKIVDDLNLGDRDIPFESMVEWINSGLNRIGAYDQFEPKTAILNIENFRALLPSDFYRVNSKLCMIPHKIGHNTIVVESRSGSLRLHYLAMPVDERGYPLVPEEHVFQEALLWLVASKLSLRGELLNKQITFEYADSRWKRFMLAARAEANMGDIQFVQARANDRARMRYSTNPLRDGSFIQEGYLRRDNNGNISRFN